MPSGVGVGLRLEQARQQQVRVLLLDVDLHPPEIGRRKAGAGIEHLADPIGAERLVVIIAGDIKWKIVGDHPVVGVDDAMAGRVDRLWQLREVG